MIRATVTGFVTAGLLQAGVAPASAEVARTHLGASPSIPALGQTALVIHDYSLEGSGPRDPHLVWRVMMGTQPPKEAFIGDESGITDPAFQNDTDAVAAHFSVAASSCAP